MPIRKSSSIQIFKKFPNMVARDTLNFPVTEKTTKRQRRRLRASPSNLKQWITTLSDHQGMLQIWIDLDNSADSLEQLENSKAVSESL